MNKSQKAFFDAFDNLTDEIDSTDFDVDSLCKLAGYKRQTFYYNFRSKQEFLSSYFKYLFFNQIAPIKKLDKEDVTAFLSSFITLFKNRNLLVRNLIFSDGYREFIFDFFKDYYISKIILLLPDMDKGTSAIVSGALLGVAFEASMDDDPNLDVDLLSEELLAVINTRKKKGQ